MSAGVTFDTSDINRLSADLTKAAGKIGPGVQIVIRKTAFDVEADAMAFCPVDTGNLKSTIGHSDLRTVGQSGTLEVEIGPTAKYGGHVEFGTSQHGPAAYMGPALDRRAPEFYAALEQLAGNVLP